MRTCTFIVATVLALVGGAASAQATLTFTPVNASGPADSEVMFSGTLTNPSPATDTLSLDGITFNIDQASSTSLSGDDAPFYTDTPFQLDAGTSTYSGPLFGINVSPGTPAQDYTFSATINGTDTDNSTQAQTPYTSTQNFTLTVVPAPEPASFLPLLFGGLGLGTLALKARRRATQST